MIVPHQDVETPESATPIWRYMSVEKLLSLLTTSALWFSRCDRFEDGWEGHYSPASFETFKKSYKAPADKLKELWDLSFADMNRRMRMSMYVNCWHINDEDSAAFWQIHSGLNKCVAIKTTMHHLRNAFNNVPIDIYAGKVHYIDFETTAMSTNNLMTPFLRKRRSFSFETELRLLYWNTSSYEALSLNLADVELPEGIKIQVDLPTLIQSVFISPNAEPHLKSSIEVLLSKCGLGAVKPSISNLFDKPT